MAIIIQNSIDGKVCSTCGIWKPLMDYPTDPTHGLSQSGRHCRCKECHRKKTREKAFYVMNDLKVTEEE